MPNSRPRTKTEGVAIALPARTPLRQTHSESAVDAMTNARPYRKALPLEVALREIERCSRTQFDPLVAEAFLSLSRD